MAVSKLHLLIASVWTVLVVVPLILILLFGYNYGFMLGFVIWTVVAVMLSGGIVAFRDNITLIGPPVLNGLIGNNVLVANGEESKWTRIQIRPSVFRRGMLPIERSLYTVSQPNEKTQMDAFLNQWKLFSSNWTHAVSGDVEQHVRQLHELLPSSDTKLDSSNWYVIESYLQPMMVHKPLFKRLSAVNRLCGSTSPSSTLNSTQIGYLKQVSTDLLLAAALIPARLDRITYQKHPSFPLECDVMRYSISLVPLECSVRLLKLFISNRAEPSLWTLVERAYDNTNANLSFPHRLLWLSLCQYASQLRKRIMEDPLWLSYLSLPPSHLGPWLFACSSHMEQYFLNTCKTAAYNQSLVSHAPLVVVLLNLSEMVCDAIRSHGGPEYCYYYWRTASQEEVSKDVQRFDGMLATLRESIRHCISTQSTRPLRLGDTFAYTQDWNFIMQRMSQYFLAQRPVYLTAKPVPDDWESSAKYMAVLSALLLVVPGKPPLATRTRGAPRTLPRMRQQFLTYAPQVEVSMRHYWESSHSLKRQMLSLTERVRVPTTSEEAALALVADLWQLSWSMGGIIVGCSDRIIGIEVAHLGFLTPFLDQTVVSAAGAEPRSFLLSDPEYSTFKLMRFAHMLEFIRNPAFAFDLFDVE